MAESMITRRIRKSSTIYTIATGGTVTTYTEGGLIYKQHVFNYSTSNLTFAVTEIGTDPSIEVWAWGAGGGGGADRGARGVQYFTGGSGARAYMKYNIAKTSYTVSVGKGGGPAAGGCIAGTGGGAAGTSSAGYNGGRGGHPSVQGCSSPGGGGGAGTSFLLGSTELLVAAGGGGGGGVETGSIGSGGRGGGGGQAGQTGAQGTGGATGNQSTKVGQTPATPASDMSGSGAGGGGYRGGGGGIVGSADGVANPGGGGGSSYIINTATSSDISNGNYLVPGDSTNTLRGSFAIGGNPHQGASTTTNGTFGTDGILVIRYVSGIA